MTKYVSYCNWLISHSIMSSRFIHVVACNRFIHKVEKYFIVCRHPISFICHPSMDIQLVPVSWLLWIMLLWIWVCKYLFETQLLVLLDICPEMGLLDHMVGLFLILEEPPFHFVLWFCFLPPESSGRIWFHFFFFLLCLLTNQICDCW